MRALPCLLAALVVPAAVSAAPKKGNAKAGAAAAAALADPAMGKGTSTKTAGACAAHMFPLSEGNEWTYSAMIAPVPPTDQVKRISPPQPKTVVITVKSIEAKKGADTVVHLTEKITTDVIAQGKTPDGKDKPPTPDERTIETTITCNGKTKFEVSPDSFLFAGEPGGYLGLKIDKIDRTKDTSWKLTNGGIGDATWREEMSMHWTRVPTEGTGAKLGSGKIELERSFTPQTPEAIVTKIGTYRAEKIGLVTTGRITLESALQLDKPQEMPAGWLTTLWLGDGVGIVQVVNAYSHMYQLVDAKLK